MRPLDGGAARIGHGDCHLPKLAGSMASMSQLDAADLLAHYDCRPAALFHFWTMPGVEWTAITCSDVSTVCVPVLDSP